MNLVFRPRRVKTWVRAWGSTGEPYVGTALFGIARLFKDWGLDGPPGDFYRPPKGAAEALVSRTPLAAAVHFADEAEWNTQLESYRRGGAPAGAPDAARERWKKDWAAAVWYAHGDPRYPMGDGRPGDAGLSIHVRLAGPALGMVMRRLELAAVDPRWLPRVKLAHILFAEHADDARESGLPLWEEFLQTERPAVAETFEFAFVGRRARRSTQQRHNGGSLPVGLEER